MALGKNRRIFVKKLGQLTVFVAGFLKWDFAFAKKAMSTPAVPLQPDHQLNSFYSSIIAEFEAAKKNSSTESAFLVQSEIEKKMKLQMLEKKFCGWRKERSLCYFLCSYRGM